MNTYYDLSVHKVKPETQNAVTVTFEIPEPLKETFQLTPGQHIKLKTEIDEQIVERFYSVCHYDHHSVQVGIKRVKGGLFSNFVCDTLKDGDVLSVQAPQGDFCLPSAEQIKQEQRFFFLAAGSGITPILAMINELLNTYSHTQVVLIYVNPTRKDIMFFNLLENLKNSYLNRLSIIHVLTREARDLPMLSQRPDTETTGQLIDGFVGVNIDRAYLCGPLPLIELFRNLFIEKGLDKRKVHMELFGTPDTQTSNASVVESADGQTQQITIISQGSAQTVDILTGQNVLDAALESGANVPFACKGGVCATCKAKMLDGDGEMVINYGLEDDDVERGFVLTCQTHVTSETATFDFDVQ